MRLLFVPCALALAAFLAACGGGSQKVPANAVAVVDGTAITTAEFNTLIAQAQAIAVAQHQPKPTPGTQQYTTLRNQVLSSLVQWTELKQQAQKEHVAFTPSQVHKFLTDLAKSRYGGSMKKLAAYYKTQGMSMQLVEELVYINQLSAKIRAKVTASAKVTAAQEKASYTANIAQYTKQSSRNVEYILVKSKSLADSIEQKLKNGASFASMAKKYSLDKTTGPLGGKYTVTQGAVVPAFDSATFSLKTGELSAPVDATSAANRNYGWFIIKALGPVNKGHTMSFKEAEPTIHQQLLQQQQETLWQQWISDLQKEYQGKVIYQTGYAPPPTTTSPTSQPPTTTG